MLFFILFSFFVVTSVSRSLPTCSSEVATHSTFGNVIYWRIHPSINPCLTIRPCYLVSSSIPVFRTPRRRLLVSKSTKHMVIILLFAGDISTNPGPQHLLKISSANVRSVRDKVPQIQDFLRDECVDCLLLTETWLTATERLNTQEPDTLC